MSTVQTKPTVAVIQGAFIRDVVEMFQKQGFAITRDFTKADAVVFTGGADIDPQMYGEQPLRCTSWNSDRDEAEIRISQFFLNRPRIGICRGAQLLNVLEGGRLYQDVNGHDRPHMIRDLKTGMVYKGTSIHHQMMVPGVKGEILAVAGRATKYERYGEVLQDATDPDTRPPQMWHDNEVVLYPQTKTLCYQGHPEIGSTVEKEYFFKLIEDHLGLVGLVK